MTMVSIVRFLKSFAANFTTGRVFPRDKNYLIVGAVDAHNKLTRDSRRAGNTRDFFVVVPTPGHTSPAAPLVAGSIAVLMEKFPKLKAHHFVEAILATATRLEDADESGSGPLTGCGLVNVEAAAKWLEKQAK